MLCIVDIDYIAVLCMPLCVSLRCRRCRRCCCCCCRRCCRRRMLALAVCYSLKQTRNRWAQFWIAIHLVSLKPLQRSVNVFHLSCKRKFVFYTFWGEIWLAKRNQLSVHDTERVYSKYYSRQLKCVVLVFCFTFYE